MDSVVTSSGKITTVSVLFKVPPRQTTIVQGLETTTDGFRSIMETWEM